MSNTELINLIAVIALGLIGLVAVVVLAYAKRKGDDTLLSAIGPYEGIATELISRLDAALVRYGEVLKPVHELVAAGSSLVDDDTDWLVQIIQQPAVVDALRRLLAEAGDLTDGEPEPVQEQLARPTTDAVHPGSGS